jgi:hypothetical protein
MTITAAPATWNELHHPRIGDGTFTDKLQGAPELELAASTEDDSDDGYEYNPTYRLPDNLVELAVKKIDRANERLAKVGIDERFTYDLTEVIEMRNGRQYLFSELKLNRPSISFGGWAFAGAHDFTPAGKVLNFWAKSSAPDVVDNRCDHCGANRARTRVYTVEHPKKGTMQVGQSCLKAFLGITPGNLWALTSELELDDLERGGYETYGSANQAYATEELLIAALAASDDGKNFVTASEGDWQQPPTAATTIAEFDRLLADGETRARRALARKIIRWANSVDDSGSDYVSNLKAVLAGSKDTQIVRRKHVGLAVSAISAYRRDQEKAAVKKAREETKAAEKREYLAPVGEKVKDLVATVEVAYHDTSYFGPRPKNTTLLVLRTNDGHVLKWQSSSQQDVSPGDKVTVTTGTVKTHQMYRDTFQTVLTRAKITTDS